MSAARGALLVAAIASAFAATGCDKLGLGKKNTDGGTEATGGGVLSILDSAFEGDVTMNVSSSSGGAAKPPKTLVLGLKMPKLRVDAGADLDPTNPMLAQGVAFILDTPAKKGYALINSQKKAVILDFDKAKGGLKLPGASASPARPGAAAEPPPKIEKTGVKDTVAGYSCEVWKITSKKGDHVEACLAERLKWIDLTQLAIESPEFAAIAAVSDFNHLPLRVVTFNAANVEEGRMVVTKVDKKKLDDARFVVPADFQVVELSAMLGAFMTGGAGLAGRPGLPPGFVPPQPKKR